MARQGKAKKTTATVDFSTNTGRPYAIDEMADLAGVGTTLISQAKMVWSLGLAEELRLLREDNAAQRSATVATAMALEREHIRVEKADAEVDRLRSELARAGLQV